MKPCCTSIRDAVLHEMACCACITTEVWIAPSNHRSLLLLSQLQALVAWGLLILTICAMRAQASRSHD